MKYNRKSIIIDAVILIIPIVIMLLLSPILPDKVPIHWGIDGKANGFIDKRYSFALGAMPFALYKLLKMKYSSK